MSSREGGDTLAFNATSTAGTPETAGLAPDAAAAFERYAAPKRQESATDEVAPWRMRRGWLVRRMLLAADLLALAAAFAVVEAFFHRAQLVGQIGIGVETIIFEDKEDLGTPDAVFPNNWVSFHDDGTVVLYPMFAPSRRPER